jgi:hypothetical protein
MTSNLFEYNPHIENVMPFNPHEDMETGNLNYSELPPIDCEPNSINMTMSSATPVPHINNVVADPLISSAYSIGTGATIGSSTSFSNMPVYNPTDVYTMKGTNTTIQHTTAAHTNDTEYIKAKNQQISEKLSILREIFHHNQAHQRRSNCFWCTQPFDSQPIYIPKHKVDHIFEVYGCFCTPQCAAAHLMSERVSNSTMWERYALLNSLYCGIFGYEKDIQPAPCPHYLLDCYHGNLTIEEYRHMLLQNESVMIVDKPMARLMPELYDTNTDIPGNARIRVAAKTTQATDYALKRKTPRKSGKEIYQEQWGAVQTGGGSGSGNGSGSGSGVGSVISGGIGGFGGLVKV